MMFHLKGDFYAKFYQSFDGCGFSEPRRECSSERT